MSKRRQLYENKQNVVFEGPEPGTLVQYFKDGQNPCHSQALDITKGEGVLSNRITEIIMKRLGDMGVVSRFVKRINMREQLIKTTEPLPFSLLVHNYVNESFAERTGLALGTKLPSSIFEFWCEDKRRQKKFFVSESYVTAFKMASSYDIDDMVATAGRVADFLWGFYSAIGLKLVNFQIHFGRKYDEASEYERIIVSTEIGPHICELWDFETDALITRGDESCSLEVYEMIADRLNLNNQPPSLLDHAIHLQNIIPLSVKE